MHSDDDDFEGDDDFGDEVEGDDELGDEVEGDDDFDVPSFLK